MKDCGGEWGGGRVFRKPKLVIEEFYPEVEGATILTVTGCRYPIGVSQGVMTFCNEARVGQSYCAVHAKISYIPSKPKVKKVAYR